MFTPLSRLLAGSHRSGGREKIEKRRGGSESATVSVFLCD